MLNEEEVKMIKEFCNYRKINENILKETNIFKALIVSEEDHQAYLFMRIPEEYFIPRNHRDQNSEYIEMLNRYWERMNGDKYGSVLVPINVTYNDIHFVDIAFYANPESKNV